MSDPRKISENVFQSEVIKAARIHGWKIAHFRPAMTKHGWVTAVAGDGAGFPDCVLIREQRLIFAELKSDKGKLHPQQKEWLESLKAGQSVVRRNGGEYVSYEVYLWRPSDIDTIWEILGK